MSNEYRHLLTLLENIEKTSIFENNSMPAWLLGNMFKRRVETVANATGWRLARPGTKLYTILLSAVSSSVSHDRVGRGKSPKLLDRELMFFFPRDIRKNQLRELEMPIDDLSTATSLLKKYRLQPTASMQTQEEPDQDKKYILLDLVTGIRYAFYIYKDRNGTWQAPGSPGYSGLFYHPPLGLASMSDVVNHLTIYFRDTSKS